MEDTIHSQQAVQFLSSLFSEYDDAQLQKQFEELAEHSGHVGPGALESLLKQKGHVRRATLLHDDFSRRSLTTIDFDRFKSLVKPQTHSEEGMDSEQVRRARHVRALRLQQGGAEGASSSFRHSFRNLPASQLLLKGDETSEVKRAKLISWLEQSIEELVDADVLTLPQLQWNIEGGDGEAAALAAMGELFEDTRPTFWWFAVYDAVRVHAFLSLPFPRSVFATVRSASLVQVRKLYLIGVVHLLTKENDFLELAAGTMVSVCCTAYNIKAMPFESKLQNRLLMFTSILESLTLFFFLLVASSQLTDVFVSASVLFGLILMSFALPAICAIYNATIRRALTRLPSTEEMARQLATPGQAPSLLLRTDIVRREARIVAAAAQANVPLGKRASDRTSRNVFRKVHRTIRNSVFGRVVSQAGDATSISTPAKSDVDTSPPRFDQHGCEMASLPCSSNEAPVSEVAAAHPRVSRTSSPSPVIHEDPEEDDDRASQACREDGESEAAQWLCGTYSPPVRVKTHMAALSSGHVGLSIALDGPAFYDDTLEQGGR